MQENFYRVYLSFEASINSPVVWLYRDYLYTVMEYCRGGSLFDFMLQRNVYATKKRKSNSINRRRRFIFVRRLPGWYVSGAHIKNKSLFTTLIVCIQNWKGPLGHGIFCRGYFLLAQVQHNISRLQGQLACCIDFVINSVMNFWYVHNHRVKMS